MSFKSAIVIAIEKVENATISYNLSFATVKPKFVISNSAYKKCEIWNSPNETMFFKSANDRDKLQ